MEKFGMRLAALRKQRGMSQEELAEKLQLTRQTISKWETGASTPDLALLARLAEVLDVSANYLLGQEDRLTTKKEKDFFQLFVYVFLVVVFVAGICLYVFNHWMYSTRGEYSYTMADVSHLMMLAPVVVVVGIALFKLAARQKERG